MSVLSCTALTSPQHGTSMLSCAKVSEPLSLFGLTFSGNKLAVVQDLTFSLKICLVACVKIKNRHTLPVGNESLKLQA